MANTRQSNAPAKHIGVRLPAPLSKQLDALALRENNSVSAVVRRLLTKALREDTARSAVERAS